LQQVGLSAAALIVRAVDNSRTSPELVAYRRQVGKQLAVWWKNRSTSAHPAIQEFHRVHQLFGVSGESVSTEKLILYARRHKDLPAVNALVDCYNLVSARTLLSLGGHDLDKLATPVTLRRTTAEDVFVPLGQTEEKRIPGEYGYVDPQGRVICRLEVLQGDYSKATPATRNVFFILQGNRWLPPSAVLKGTWLLAEMAEKFCGGKAELVAFNAAPADAPAGGWPTMTVDAFKRLNLRVGTVVKTEPVANLPALSAVTVKAGSDVEALAASPVLVDLVGTKVVVATELHALTVGSRAYGAYVLGVQVVSAIPDGARLY
jgi:DNA/RNA-binding domain of Phe-tRNA-synthetase-like protein